MLKERITAK